MDFIGFLAGLTRDIKSRKFYIQIECDEEEALIFEDNFNQGQKLNIKVTKWTKQRSLDANGYMWALLTHIANHKEIKTSKEEMYEQMLHSYGSLVYDDDGNLSKMQIPYNEDPSKKPGHWLFNRDVTLYDKDDKPYYFKEYIEIKGSSKYNAEEMRVLLDGVIEAAKEIGIQTVPMNEYQAMLDDWGKAYDKAQKHNNR